MTQDQNEPYEEAGLIKRDEDEDEGRGQTITERISEEIEKRISGRDDEDDR
jgi:hypothetical protein